MSQWANADADRCKWQTCRVFLATFVGLQFLKLFSATAAPGNAGAPIGVGTML